MREELLRMKNISAESEMDMSVDEINILVRKGECLALAGLDNSGKDTVVAIFQGKAKIKKGIIYLKGNAIGPFTRNKFEKNKVFYIDYKNVYIDHMDLAENIFLLGNNSLKKLIINRKAMHIQTDYLMKKYDLHFSSYTMAKELSKANKHLVSIVRAADQGASLIVLNKLTSEYSIQELERLNGLIQCLQSENIGVLINDNKLEFLHKIADRMIIIRDGKLRKKLFRGDKIENLYIAMLDVGHSVGKRFDNHQEDKEKINSDCEVQIEYRNIIIDKTVEPISFQVVKGEILAVVTFDSEEQAMLWHSISCQVDSSSELIVRGKKIDCNSMDCFVKERIVFFGNNDLEEELFNNLSVNENIFMPSMKRASNRMGFFSSKYIKVVDKEKPIILTESDKSSLSNLSKNDKLRVVLERWKMFNPYGLLMRNPLSKADVLGKEIIRNELYHIKKRGTSIVILESDLMNSADVADRIIIIHNGKITKEFSPEEVRVLDVNKYL